MFAATEDLVGSQRAAALYVRAMGRVTSSDLAPNTVDILAAEGARKHLKSAVACYAAATAEGLRTAGIVVESEATLGRSAARTTEQTEQADVGTVGFGDVVAFVIAVAMLQASRSLKVDRGPMGDGQLVWLLVNNTEVMARGHIEPSEPESGRKTNLPPSRNLLHRD